MNVTIVGAGGFLGPVLTDRITALGARLGRVYLIDEAAAPVGRGTSQCSHSSTGDPLQSSPTLPTVRVTDRFSFDLQARDFGLPPAAWAALQHTEALLYCLTPDDVAALPAAGRLEALQRHARFLSSLRSAAPQLSSLVLLSSLPRGRPPPSSATAFQRMTQRFLPNRRETSPYDAQHPAMGFTEDFWRAVLRGWPQPPPHTTVLRLSHVGPAFRHPHPGYFQNLLQPLPGLCALVALNAAVAAPLPADRRACITPVDVLASAMLAALLSPPPRESHRVRCVTVCPSATHPVCWGRLLCYMEDYYSRQPLGLRAPLDSSSASVSSSSAKSSLWSLSPSPTASRINPCLPLYLFVAEAQRSVRSLHLHTGAAGDPGPPAPEPLSELCPAAAPDLLEELALDLAQLDWQLYAAHACHQVALRLGADPQALLPPCRTYEGLELIHGSALAKRSSSLAQRLFPDVYFAATAWLDGMGQNHPAGKGLSEERRSRILASPEVRYRMEQLQKGPDAAEEEEVMAEACGILKRIGDQLCPAQLRPVAYAMRKVLARLYTRVNLNPNAADLLWKAHYGHFSGLPRRPGGKRAVVYVPTHQSYMDFLVLSYILFALGLPLPHIAAGEDFLQLSGVSTVLRCCGAFFMRRQIPGDSLYGALFKGYVKALVQDGETVEFFIEGTRSRSGKRLTPKKGVLKIILNAFLERDGTQLDDVVLVPVAITFDKLLEAGLYAQELQGGTKPPESLANLLRAASVLLHSFGSVHFHVGTPISLQRLLADPEAYQPYECDRLRGHLESARPTGDSSTVVTHTNGLLGVTSWLLTHAIQQGLTVTPTSMLAAVLLHRFPFSALLRGVGHDVLRGEVAWLRTLLLARGVQIEAQWRTAPVEELLRFAIRMLTPGVSDNGAAVHLTGAKDGLYLQLYSNQLVHLFIDEAVIYCAARSLSSPGGPPPPAAAEWAEDVALEDRAVVLRAILSAEFPLFDDEICPEAPARWFRRNVAQLSEGAGRTWQPEAAVYSKDDGHRSVDFACHLLYPFLEAYWAVAVACQALELPRTLDATVEFLMAAVDRLLLMRALLFPQVTSLDTLRNALGRMVDLGWVQKADLPTGCLYQRAPDRTPEALAQFAEQLNALRFRPYTGSPARLQQWIVGSGLPARL